jgi:hypothetical protein
MIQCLNVGLSAVCLETSVTIILFATKPEIASREPGEILWPECDLLMRDYTRK